MLKKKLSDTVNRLGKYLDLREWQNIQDHELEFRQGMFSVSEVKRFMVYIRQKSL